MEVKEISGHRLQPGDMLVVVPESPMPQDIAKRISQFAMDHGISVLVLPHNAKVYVK